MSNFQGDIFSIRKVVLVDSAGLGFVEVPVDKHALIVGPGNIGKSSILNAIRLFLLPENNFKNCRNKFAFRMPKGDGYFSNEEVVNHYFPSERSFLILECENYVGRFCQILYKGAYLSYNRIFTPFDFDHIRELFWQVNDEDAIGQAVDDLSVSRLTAELKRRSRDTEVASDVQKLKKLLYGDGELLDANAMRYCVFPLEKPDDKSIESLRALILLMFEMNAGSEGVVRAIANLMEAGKKSEVDFLDFDIDAFLNLHEELEIERQSLNQLYELIPEYTELSKKSQQLKQLTKLPERYYVLRQSVEINKSNMIAVEQEQGKVLEKLLLDKRAKEAQLQQAKNEHSELKNKIKSSQTQVISHRKAMDRVDLSRAGYSSQDTDQDIIDDLNFYLQEKQEELKAHTDKKNELQLKFSLEKEVNNLNKWLEQAHLNQDKAEFLLQGQLAPHLSSPLSAVNKQLIMANPGRKLGDNELNAIERFTELFELTDKGYRFFDIDLVSQNAITQHDLRKAIQNKESELKYKEQSLERLNRALDDKQGLARKANIDSIKKEIEAAEVDVKTLSQASYHELSLQNFTDELKSYKSHQEESLKRVEIKQKSFDSIGKEYDAKKESQRENKDKLTKFINIERDLIKLSNLYHIPEISHTDYTPSDIVTEEDLEVLEQDLKSYTDLKHEVIQDTQRLIYKKVIDFQEGLHQSPSSEVVESAISQLSQVFNELGSRDKLLKNRIYEHNESVSSYTKILNDNAKYVSIFESELNRSFSDIKVNDIAEIQVAISIEPKFRNLVAEISNLDPHSNDLLSREFYSRLQVFMSSFFGAGESLLTMDKIITGLSYRTRKQSQSAFESKAQSTSTTELINFELVQILLSRMIGKNKRLEMPLVFDEVTNVNLNQFDWLLPRLSVNGFSLFSASTQSAGTELIRKIGCHFELGTMQSARPYNATRDIVFFGGGEGFEAINSETARAITMANQSDWLEDRIKDEE